MNAHKLNGRTVTINGEQMTVNVRTYANSGRPRIDINTEFEPYGTLTVNDNEVLLEQHEMLVKTWSENEYWYHQMLKTGWFEDTGRRVTMGYVEAQVWRVL